MTFIEVKIPKEIRQYKESIFFGLSARQFFCTIPAVGIAAGVYLLLGPVIGRETASWLCILLPYRDDWLDHYREEANQIMKDRAAQSNNLVQERFVTLSIPQRKIEESRAYFRRAEANLQKTFARLSYGIHEVSKNPLICDRKRLVSPHGFYLGVSGSGKSMGMKNTIMNVALGTEDDIFILDAEREYGSLARAFGGAVVEISPHSAHHINPLELVSGYEDENPIAQKSALITSILEQQMATGAISGSYKSIIDRCTANIYKPYLKGKAPVPLLTNWRKEVLRQPEPEAREIALAAELITEGSLNVFAHHSDVDMSNRIAVLDLYEMGEQLWPTALVVALEAIQNRVMENRKRGKFTWVFLDEVYLYFRYHYSAEILYRAWKRFRKYGGILTAATQNVEECLRSDTARLMFANSEFLMLFNQAATDRQELSNLLHISDTQMGYVTDVEPGHGLLRVAGAVIPFDCTIPKDTELYRLMNTSPGHGSCVSP